jgi:hypothetical protein
VVVFHPFNVANGVPHACLEPQLTHAASVSILARGMACR